MSIEATWKIIQRWALKVINKNSSIKHYHKSLQEGSVFGEKSSQADMISFETGIQPLGLRRGGRRRSWCYCPQYEFLARRFRKNFLIAIPGWVDLDTRTHRAHHKNSLLLKRITKINIYLKILNRFFCQHFRLTFWASRNIAVILVPIFPLEPSGTMTSLPLIKWIMKDVSSFELSLPQSLCWSELICAISASTPSISLVISCKMKNIIYWHSLHFTKYGNFVFLLFFFPWKFYRIWIVIFVLYIGIFCIPTKYGNSVFFIFLYKNLIKSRLLFLYYALEFFTFKQNMPILFFFS